MFCIKLCVSSTPTSRNPGNTEDLAPFRRLFEALKKHTRCFWHLFNDVDVLRLLVRRDVSDRRALKEASFADRGASSLKVNTIVFILSPFISKANNHADTRWSGRRTAKLKARSWKFSSPTCWSSSV